MPWRPQSWLSMMFPALRRMGGIVLMIGLAWISPSAHAFRDGDPLPTFDRRQERITGRASAPTAVQLAAEESLRSRLPTVRLDYDPIRRSPVHIRCLEGCLTGPGGAQKGVALQAGEGLPFDEPYRPLKAFLQAETGLFGHGPEVIIGRPPAREVSGRRNRLRTVVWEQRCADIPVFEAVLIGHLTATDELLALSSTFLPDPESLVAAGNPVRQPNWGGPPVDVLEAILRAALAIEEPVEPADIEPLEPEAVGAERRQQFTAPPLLGRVDARLTWLPLAREQVALCWCIELTRRQGGERYQVLIDTDSGEVLVRRCQTLYLQDATYEVFTSDSPSPFSPASCTATHFQPPLVPRSRVTLAAQSTNASPLGWISPGENETRGNNVDAHLDLNADDFPDLPRPQGRPFRVFSPPLDLSLPAEENTEASVVQLFYWCNFMHDALYELGFDEASGNFQKDNLGRGGRGGDPILADAQDGSGVNNANFTPSPDGEPGRIQMFVFDGTEPTRDGDLDAEIVLHEYTHGLSTRLVGGGVGITTLQGGGLGEGWSDFYALALLSQSSDDVDACYAMGGYVTKGFFGLEENYYFGIRRYPYSTDLTKNPLTFKDIDPNQISEHEGVLRNPVFPFARALAGEVHNQGEVWCVTLWEARALLIRKHGFDAGNRIMLELVTDGMRLAPPNPNFLQARDAILQADLVNHGGQNQPLLWAAFAKRGMGFSAESPVSSTTTGVREAFDLPDALGLERTPALVFTGEQSEPFFNPCRSLILTNHSDSPVRWVAAAQRAEFEVRPNAGVLAPHAGLNLTICLTQDAQLLPVGRVLDTLSVTNLSSGVVQRRALDIRVLRFAEMPFTEDFEGGRLRPEWLVSNPEHGRVQLTSLGGPHSGAAHLVMDSFSDGLPARNEVSLGINLSGWTNVVLRFWAREFSDEPNPAPVGLFPDGADFDGVAISTNGVSWLEVQGLRRLTATNQEIVVQLDAPVAQYGLHYGEHFQIRFNQFDNYPVPLDGIAIDDVELTGTPYRRFKLELPATVIEGAPTNFPAAVVLGAPADRDVLFTLFSDQPEEVTPYLTTLVRKGETRAEFFLRPGNNSKLDGSRRVQIRGVAVDYHGSPETLLVQDDETATLALTLPGLVQEGSPPLVRAGRVTVSRRPDNDLAIALRSSNPKKLTVPGTIIIPKGETAARFDLTAVDGVEIDGRSTVEVRAEVAGWEPAVAAVDVDDNEEPTLRLVLPTVMSEGNPPNPGRLVLGGTVRSNVIVRLTSNLPTELRIPRSITVEAGESSTAFDLEVMDDELAQGVRSVRLEAEADQFRATTGTLNLLDDETPPRLYAPTPADGASNQPPKLQLRWQPGFGEILVNGDFEAGNLSGWRTASESAQGFILNDGNVNPDGPDTPAPAYEGDFSALLAQDGPGTHVLWQDISIPEDAKSAQLSWFDFIHNHGTEYFDPSQQYRVEIQDRDGKLLEEAFTTRPGDPLSTPWTRHEFDLTAYRGQTIRLMFAEQDALGFINVGIDNVSVMLGTTGTTEFEIFLGRQPDLGPQDRVARVATNSWLAVDLPPLTELYWQVASVRGAARTVSPVWRFMTRSVGQLDHFGWSPLPSQLGLGEVLNAVLKAQDEFGLTVTNFNGEASLGCFAGAASSDTVLVTEIDPGRDDQVEFTNVSPGPVDIGGWQISFYDISRWPTPKKTLLLPANTVVPPAGTFTIREGGRAPGVYPDFRLGTNVNWGFLAISQPVAVLVQDAHSNLVDFVTAVDADPKVIRQPLVLPTHAWNSSPLAPINSQSNTWQRVGGSNQRANLDWVIAARTFGTLNPQLTLPFEPINRIPVQPEARVVFTNGVWAGPLMLPAIETNLVLTATDGLGHVGRSGSFIIAGADDLAIRLVEKPASVFLDQEISFRYLVTHTGPGTMDGVEWTATLPAGARLLSNESSQGTWEVTPHEVKCRLGRLSGDSSVELRLKLSAGQPGRLTNQCTVTCGCPEAFLDNNHLEAAFDVELPLLVISDARIPEGDSGTTTAPFRVRLSAPTQREVTVHYQTVDEGATAGSDYAATAGTLVFPPGSTNQSIPVKIFGDTLYEVQERFLVRLDSPVNAALGDGEAVGTLLEEELEPRLVVEDVTIGEGSPETGTNTALVSIRLTGKSSQEAFLTYYTVDRTARSVSDYVAQRGQMVFRVGETQQLVRIPLVADLRPEPEETFLLALTNVFGISVTKGEGVITIKDDDAGRLAALDWESWAPTQHVGRAFAVTLAARDSNGQLFTQFSGPARLRAFTSRREVGPIGQSNLWEFPLSTYFHDSRSQFLYPAEELGPAGIIRELKLAVDTIPGQMLEQFTVRIKSVPNSQFTTADWDSADWTTVLQSDLLVTDPGTLTLPLAIPFRYDGQQSIMIDLSFDNSSYSYDGLSRSVETLNPRGRVFESDSAFGAPLDWRAGTPPAELVNRVAEVRFVIDQEVSLNPQLTGRFLNGVWSGEVTVLSAAAEVVLEASTADGLTGFSSAFGVLAEEDPAARPRIVRIYFRENDLVLEFLGKGDQLYQLEAAERLLGEGWQPVGAQTAGNPGATVVIETGGATHPRRFYRVRQLP